MSRQNLKRKIMKKLAFVAAIGALAMAGGAYAQSGDSDSVTISGPAHKIEIPDGNSQMRPENYYDYQGGYNLSNGKTLVISSRGSKMYAEVGDMGRHEMVATARNTFVAKDKKLEVTIDLHANAEPTGVLYMMVPVTAQEVVAPVAALPAPALTVAQHSGKTKAGKAGKIQVAKAAPVKTKATQPQLLSGEKMIMVAMR